MTDTPQRASSLSRRQAIAVTVGIASLLTGGCEASPTSTASGRVLTRVSSGKRLRSPFPVAVANPRAARRLSECETAPDAVTEVKSISKYVQTDRTKSTIDPEAEARLRAETAPVAAFSRTIVSFADDVAADPDGSRAQADCAWSWLEAWAGQKALEGPSVDESLRKWELAALACAVIKLQQGNPEAAVGREATLAWLTRLGNEVKADYSNHPKSGSRRNNHRYWAAWAAVSAGVAANDRSLYDWGMGGYRIGIDEIQDDGSLPLEIARGSRAMGYHSFALTPLLLMAETGEANGQPLYAMKKHRLSLLIRYLLDNFDDPTPLTRLAGAEQDIPEAIKSSNVVWLEPWYARTGDPQAERWLREYRPLTHKGAGGNLTMIFGKPLPGATG